MPTPIKLKRYTGSAYEILQPETTWSQVTDKPSTFTPTAHTHVVADITNNNTLVKTTGNQTIDGVKTFTDTIFINGSINSDGGTIQVNVDSLNVDGGISADGGVDVKGNIRLTGTPTTTNQSRTIEFTGFDKEGTTDFSDNAYIRHTVNSGGLTGSVLEISSQNDAEDGINFLTSSSNNFRHNGSVIITGNNIGSQSVNYASSSGNADTVDGYHETAFVRLSANSSSPTNGAFAIGNASSRNFIQSHNGQPLDINPLGNNVILNSGAGSVGIGGTTSFAEKLNIEGRIKLNGPGASFILFATENTNRGYVYIDNSSRMGFLSSGGGWIWQISNSGLLQVGTVPYARTTGVAATDSTNTVSGGLRSRIIGSTLYLTNNGTTAG